MTKEKIIQAIHALAEDVDLDPQSRYDMLGEIGAVVEDEADTLADENDLDDDFDDEWEPTDEFDDEDDSDDEFDFDGEDDFDDEDR